MFASLPPFYSLVMSMFVAFVSGAYSFRSRSPPKPSFGPPDPRQQPFRQFPFASSATGQTTGRSEGLGSADSQLEKGFASSLDPSACAQTQLAGRLDRRNAKRGIWAEAYRPGNQSKPSRREGAGSRVEHRTAKTTSQPHANSLLARTDAI
ncbi:unnamed protein product [Protopolystoma xenopodis]|uniref:Uncharacterized protein n=1 Tax=Protopolystoma xenopodis TaxID=117903 RepID=A0A3S5FC74_9PLAT|nr:unnamed protein product [Protopolystoma xenopodis]